MDEWIALLRALWSGEPEAVDGAHYTLPGGVLAYPTPSRAIAILVGGMSPAALRRARENDGWFALQHTDALDVRRVEAGVGSLRAGAGDTQSRVVLRAAGDIEPLLALLPEFGRSGVTDIVVDADLTDLDSARTTLERVRAALG